MTEEAIVALGSIALIGFLLKTTILFHVELKSRITESFAVLCLCFVVQNAAEFLGYITYFKSQALGEFFVHIYMVATYFVFPSAFILALAMSNSRNFAKVRIILYSIASALSLAHIGGFLVSGFKFIGWTLITTPGPYYWVAMAFIFSLAIATMVYLAIQVIAHQDFEIRKRCKVNLMAFSPLFFVLVSVLILRAAGLNASSAISMVMASITFLVIMLLQTNGNLFWLSLKIKIIEAVIRMRNINSLDDILERVETIRIEEALKETNGMQKDAAALLGVPPSTLCKKIAKYNIGADKERTVIIYS